MKFGRVRRFSLSRAWTLGGFFCRHSDVRRKSAYKTGDLFLRTGRKEIMRPAFSILVLAAVMLACFLSAHAAASQSPAGQPTLDEPRVWTDVSGRFSRTAVLVEVRADEVRLRQPSGRHTTIAWDKLSAADQEFAREFVARASRPTENDPTIADARIWTDSTGRLQSTARLVAIHDNVLVLQKLGGKRVTVRRESLSRQDQEFVRAVAGSLRSSTQVAHAGESRPTAPRVSETGHTTPDARRGGGVQSPARAQLTASSPFPLLPAWASPSAPAKIIHLQVSRQFLDRFVPHDVNTSDAVNDVIVGTPVSGSSTTHGQGSIVLVPSAQQAIADIFFAGSSQANTVSDGGRAQVFSYSTTDFQARKRIVLDSGGLHALPTTSTACTNAQTCGICSSLPGLRGAIARRITERRTDDARWQANQESSSHFEQALNRHLDNDVTSALAEIMRVDRQFFAATKQGGLKLRRQCSSTADRIDIAILRTPADANQLPIQVGQTPCRRRSRAIRRPLSGFTTASSNRCSATRGCAPLWRR